MLGQAYVSSLPQMLRYFQNQGQASPLLSFPVKTQPNGDKRGPASVLQEGHKNIIWLQMLQFKFSLFYVKEEKGPISKRKKKKVSSHHRLWQIYYYLSW